MKILFLFCDMLRAESLKSVNGNISEYTQFDEYLKELNGTVYSNCYTPAPDTPRSMGCLYSGMYPQKNGCQKRIQWPYYYFKNDIKNIYDLFLDKDYSVIVKSLDHYIKTGFFPRETIEKIDVYEDLKDTAKAIKNSNNDNIFSLIYLPDFHWVVDQGFSDKNTNKIGHQHLVNCFEQLFDIVPKDTFDYIFIFSDHGCKLSCDNYKNKFDQLNDSRSKIVMFMHKKGDTQLNTNTELRSIMDLYPTMEEILQNEKSKFLDGISLFEPITEREIVLEDHSTFLPSIEAPVDLWAVRTNEYFFFRSLDKSCLKKVIGNNYEIVTEPCQNIIDNMLASIKRVSSSYEENIKQHEILKSYGELNNTNRCNQYYSDGLPISRKKVNVYLRKVVKRLKLLFKKNF